MINKCPCCDNTILVKVTNDNIKQGLVKIDMNSNPPAIHADKVLPVDVYVCKECSFVMLTSERITDLAKSQSQD